MELMRKVLFKKWIPRVEEKTSFGTKTKQGTACWEEDFVNEGLFHQWANACEESDAGFGNYTIALVEIADGTIIEVLPQQLKFTDKDIIS